MQTLLLISLTLLIWVILPGLIVGVVFLFKHLRTQRKIRELDQKIFAYESGADKVVSTPRDIWLENLINFKGLSPKMFYRPKDVLVEMHKQYKAYYFVYSTRFSIFNRPLNGLIIQFKNVLMPSFLVSKEEPPQYLVRSLTKFNLNMFNRAFPPDLHVYGDIKSEREIRDFWKEFVQLKDIFDTPRWETMWVNQSFVVLYFEASRSRTLDLKKEMFGLDETIAQVILGEQHLSNDPAMDIRLLKENENETGSAGVSDNE